MTYVRYNVMAGKTQKLEGIMGRICIQEGIQEGIDITIGYTPARLYFTFENAEHPFLNTNGSSVEEVFQIAKKYGLQRDKSKPKYKPGNRVALGFKLKFKK